MTRARELQQPSAILVCPCEPCKAARKPFRPAPPKWCDVCEVEGLPLTPDVVADTWCCADCAAAWDEMREDESTFDAAFRKLTLAEAVEYERLIGGAE